MRSKSTWAASAAGAVLMLMIANAASAQDAPVDNPEKAAVADILVLGRGSENFANDKALATIRETPSSITLIDSERMEKQRLLTLDDLMKQTAGVTVARSVATYPRFFARGFQVSSFLIDGTPQQGFASAPYSLPDLFLFDRVEFLRGPSALFSGSGSPGGSVNLVRKRPGREPAVKASISGGSWDFFRGELDVTTPLTADGGVRTRVGVMAQDAGDFIRDFEKDRRNAFGAVDVDLGSRTTLSFGGYYDAFTTTQGVGLPGGQGVGLLSLPRDTFIGGSGNKARTELAQGYVQLNHKFAEGWKMRATVQYNDLRRHEFYLFTRGPVTSANSSALNLETYRGQHKADSLSADASVTGEYEMFGHPGGIILGADYQRSDWRFDSNYAYAQNPPLTIDIYHPVLPPMPVFPIGPRTANFYQGREIKKQYGVYGQTRVQPVTDLTVVVGGRVGWVTYETQDFDLTPNGVYSIKGKLTPYVGLTYDVAPGWTLYSSYADVFEPQSAFDRNGKPLGPVSGTQIEAGVKTNVFGNRFLLTAAVYRIRQSNRAVGDLTNPSVSIASGLVEGKGFEIELNGRVLPGWSINGGYNFNVNKILSDTNPALQGRQFTPVIPKHSVKLFTDYSFPAGGKLKGLNIGGGVTLNSQQRGTGVVQPGYLVADLRAGYDINDWLNLSLNVNNVFDKTYYAEVNDLMFSNWYGPPRSAFVTLKANY